MIERARAHASRRRSAEPDRSTPGCAFHPRCPFANERCRRERPELIDADGTLVACHAVAEARLPADLRMLEAG